MNIHTPSAHLLCKGAFVVPITAAVVKGAATDCRGYTRALAIFRTKPTGTGTTSDCKLQESDTTTDGDFADVASATFAEGTTVGGEVTEVMDIDLTKRKRYLRLVHTGVGASAAGAASGTIVLINSLGKPVTQDVTPVSV